MEDLVAAEALGDIASARADLARGGQAVNDYDPDEVRLEHLSGLLVCCCQVRLHAVSWHSKYLSLPSALWRGLSALSTSGNPGGLRVFQNRGLY